MTKIKVSRVFELAKYLATKSGQELTDFLQYVSDLADQVIRTLRNGITFADNVDCKYLTVSLLNNTAATVNVGARRAVGIVPLQVVSTLYGIDSWAWYVDAKGATNVLGTFTGSPSASTQISVVLLVLYG